MIVLEGIEKVYQNGHTTKALKGVTLHIEPGELFGILGRKGAGKSALIRCINLLEPPLRGRVLVDNCDLRLLSPQRLREVRRDIGMVFQHFNLLDHRTVAENIALPLELSGHSKAERSERLGSLLALTELTEKKEAYPHQLTYAEKQRTALARALIHRPKILLCEEITAFVETRSRASILKLLRQVNEQLGVTVVLITHELDIIKLICDRAAVMDQGKIIEQGKVLDLLTHPQSWVTQELIKVAARHDLPLPLKNRLQPLPSPHANPIVHIAFPGTVEPQILISKLAQTFKISINIIQAHLESVKQSTIGNIILEMIGLSDEINQAIDFLRQKNLHTEVLGYASRLT